MPFTRLSTDGGFGTRTLYENEDETVFDAKRPVILNGIEDFVTRGDFLERSIILRHPAIADGRRRLESELYAEFENARPRLMGALFDRLAVGLSAYSSIDKSRMPRMADAAAFAVACEVGMHETPRFLEAFRSNQTDAHDLILADSIIAPAIVSLIEPAGSWEGTATELYATIKPAGSNVPHGWPKKLSGLSGMLRRLAPSLLKVHGIDAMHDKRSDAKRTRIIRLTRGDAEKARETSSGASSASDDRENGLFPPNGTGRPPDDSGRPSPRPSSDEKPLKMTRLDDMDGPDDDPRQLSGRMPEQPARKRAKGPVPLPAWRCEKLPD